MFVFETTDDYIDEWFLPKPGESRMLNQREMKNIYTLIRTVSCLLNSLFPTQRPLLQPEPVRTKNPFIRH
jgi:hypothetical protein